MAAEKSTEDRARREEKADACVELVLDAIQLFIKGEAGFIVTEGPLGSKIVVFGSLPTKQEAAAS